MEQVKVSFLLGLLVCIATAIANDNNLCKHNDEKATTCLRCASLEFNDRVTFEGCCSDDTQLLICEACNDDPESCKTLMKEFQDLDTMYDEESLADGADSTEDSGNDYSNDVDGDDVQPDVEVQKRYGKLFITNPKRYGRVFFGKRNSDMDSGDIDKRYGRLYVSSGSLFGKRSMVDGFDDFAEDSAGDVDKRYGRIFVGRPSHLLRGRRVKLFGKRSDTPMDFAEFDKRYGRLFTNGKYRFGKRAGDLSQELKESSDDDDSAFEPYRKRYGSLFVSKFGKRGDESMEYDDNPMDKRFGRLYINRARLYSKPPKRLFVGKRFGRLFTNRRKNYFG